MTTQVSASVMARSGCSQMVNTAACCSASARQRYRIPLDTGRELGHPHGDGVTLVGERDRSSDLSAQVIEARHLGESPPIHAGARGRSRHTDMPILQGAQRLTLPWATP